MSNPTPSRLDLQKLLLSWRDRIIKLRGHAENSDDPTFEDNVGFGLELAITSLADLLDIDVPMEPCPDAADMERIDTTNFIPFDLPKNTTDNQLPAPQPARSLQ